jgi:hypothetical protein
VFETHFTIKEKLMSIIVSQEGENARKLEPTSIALEDYLQKYIEKTRTLFP